MLTDTSPVSAHGPHIDDDDDEEDDPIVMTEKAIEMVKEAIAAEKLVGHGLLVFVPKIELAPLHDRAIVFETPIGEGELVVSGLRLGIPAANGSSPPARMMQGVPR